jgi:hypothetical protein
LGSGRPEGDVHIGADYFGRDLRDDRVAKGAQFTHSGGNPMSQETNSGFNAPGFSVGSVGSDERARSSGPKDERI